MDADPIDRTTGILLLFEGGGRPGVKSVHMAVDNLANVSVSHDPAKPRAQAEVQSQTQSETVSTIQQDMCWLELISNGLTFDLTNLAPGRPANIPEVRSRFDCPDDCVEAECDALCLMPGPHLSGGSGSMPVIRTMFGLVAELVSQLPSLRAIFWPPAAVLVGPVTFHANVASWVAGGQFPAQCLVGYRLMSDQALQTEGLAFFTGQEIRIEPGSVGDPSIAAQLASRLVQQLVQHGQLTQTEEVIAPDGSQMRLEPSGNGKFVRVWRN